MLSCAPNPSGSSAGAGEPADPRDPSPAEVLAEMRLLQVVRVADDSAATAITTTAAAAVPLATSGRVMLLVGPGGERFVCPVHLLAAASAMLRGVMEDLLEGDADRVRPADGEGEDEEGDAIPLPFMSVETFTTVALYWEHFCSPSLPGGEQQEQQQREPSALVPPTAPADLCALGRWEQCFVLQRLLGLPPGPAAAEGRERLAAALVRRGAWVDLIAGAAADEGPPALDPRERRAVLGRLCDTLEAATRLGTAPLQRLCAALAANMLAGADAAAAASLVGLVPPLPPFTAERRAALLAKHPWAGATGGGGGSPVAARPAAAAAAGTGQGTDTAGDLIETDLGE